MATRQRLPRAAKKDKVVVLPTTHKEEEPKFSSNKLGREELGLLGVDFQLSTDLDLNRILPVRETDWSPDIRASKPRVPPSVFSEEGVKQLGAVDMDAVKRRKVDMIDVKKKLASNFNGTFRSLLDITTIQETKRTRKGQTGQIKGNSS